MKVNLLHLKLRNRTVFFNNIFQYTEKKKKIKTESPEKLYHAIQ